jgi:molecular chaperone GrpE
MPSSPASNPDHPQPAPREQREEAPARPSVEELEARNAALEDRHLRARADLENYRKRSARDLERRAAEEREALLLDWLQAVDSVERALGMDPEAEGLRAVLEQMEAILARYGVARMGAPGEPFDPERHEAIGVADGDAERPTIAGVARSGFTIDGRVLRPTQVIVTRP